MTPSRACRLRRAGTAYVVSLALVAAAMLATCEHSARAAKAGSLASFVARARAALVEAR